MTNTRTIECFFCDTDTEPHGPEGNLCEGCAREAAAAYAAECGLLGNADIMPEPAFWQDSGDPESGPGDHTLPHRFFYR